MSTGPGSQYVPMLSEERYPQAEPMDCLLGRGVCETQRTPDPAIDASKLDNHRTMPIYNLPCRKPSETTASRKRGAGLTCGTGTGRDY